MAIVVASQHADIRPRPSRPGPVRPSAVVLHVKPPRRGVVPNDFVDALTELGIGIWREAGADALIGRPKCLTTVLAQIMATSGDTEVHPIPVANNRVHAEPAVAGVPLARVLVVADARHRLP